MLKKEIQLASGSWKTHQQVLWFSSPNLSQKIQKILHRQIQKHFAKKTTETAGVQQDVGGEGTIAATRTPGAAFLVFVLKD